MKVPEISLIIKSRRKELKMTLEDIAKDLGVNRSTICRWEKGEINGLKRAQIYSLSKTLHLPIEVLLNSKSNDKEEDIELTKIKINLIKKINSITDKTRAKEIQNFIEFTSSK